MGYLPEHLVRRFIAKEGDAVLVTGRLPDVDSSRILPVVEKIDRALDDVRKQHPDFRISVTGLPAIAARNSARMISQLNEALPLCVAFAAVLLAIAFRSVFVGLVSLLPGLYPVVASGAILWAMGGGLEFASVVALLVVFGLAIDALIHFFNRLSLEERKRAARRSRHPQRPRAGGPGHHPDHAGAGVRSRRDGVLGPAVPAHLRLRVRHDADRLAAGRPGVPAGLIMLVRRFWPHRVTRLDPPEPHAPHQPPVDDDQRGGDDEGADHLPRRQALAEEDRPEQRSGSAA